jgi:hypothetical protein
MDLKNFIESKPVAVLLMALGGVVVVLLIFQAGVYTGYRKAGFSLRLGESYNRVLEGREFPAAHGAAGQVVSVALPTFVLSEPDGDEKIVRISDATLIRRFHDTIASTSITAGDYAVVIGEPNDAAQIDATFVRILPPPPH